MLMGVLVIVCGRKVETEIRKPQTVYISISDPNIALLIADKDATILRYQDKVKVLEKRYYDLAGEFNTEMKGK